MLENQSHLNQHVLSEVALLELLNIEINTLNALRLGKGLPYIRLNMKNRVYLAEEVLAWLKKQRYTA